MRPAFLATIAAFSYFVSAGCNTPSTATPANTSILKTAFTNAQGGPPAEHASIAPTRHVKAMPVAQGAAEIEVRLDTVDTPAGKYVHGVDVVVLKNGGGTLSAEVPAGMMPINRGTPEAVLASVTLMVTWQVVTRTSTSLRQTSIELSGDGIVSSH